ncbi:hypothetical protein GCM10008942_30500 [Rhizomicrobium electricum]|uniref:Uncharacterized protein n=1 Tax=Rhizomicrobium electricum TaxID=480070 RepID=A0ABN1F0V4_9PROT
MRGISPPLSSCAYAQDDTSPHGPSAGVKSLAPVEGRKEGARMGQKRKARPRGAEKKAAGASGMTACYRVALLRGCFAVIQRTVPEVERITTLWVTI